MLKRTILDGIILGLSIGTVLIGTSIFYTNYKIRKLRKSIIPANALDESKDLNKSPIIKGNVTGKCFHQPINLSGLCEIDQNIVHCFYIIHSLDRSMNVVSEQKMTKIFFKELQLGSHTLITVKIDSNTVIYPMMFYEKVVELDLTWWRYLFSFVTSRIKCFEKTIISIVPANHDIYVEGKLSKDSTNNYSIEAVNVYTSQDQIFCELRIKQRNLLVLLGGYSVSLLFALIWRKSGSNLHFNHPKISH